MSALILHCLCELCGKQQKLTPCEIGIGSRYNPNDICECGGKYTKKIMHGGKEDCEYCDKKEIK